MWEHFRKKNDIDDDAFSGTTVAIKCYESHPPLKIGKGMLHGGRASSPIAKADAYVSLQSGSTSGRSSDPWDPPGTVEVFYAISDMQTPTDVPRFKKMVTWICTQLQKGKTVHVGCIGGHGRTGLVLSAIVAEALGKKDAIQWVRKHYCKKAVESRAQVQFLMKHYGVTTVEATKEHKLVASEKGSTSFKSTLFERVEEEWRGSAKPRKLVPEGVQVRTKSYEPMLSGRSLWLGKKKKS